MARVTVTSKGTPPVDPLENSGATYRALYEYILRMARKEGAEEERQGVPGYLWEGSMTGTINDLYPGRDDLDVIVKRLGNHRMRTVNLVVAVRGNNGKGQRKETLWWVRAEWSDETVKLPQRKSNPNTAETSLETRQELGTQLATSSAYGKSIPGRDVVKLKEENETLTFSLGKLRDSLQSTANENADLRERILSLESLEIENRHLRSIIKRFVQCADDTTLIDLVIGDIPNE